MKQMRRAWLALALVLALSGTALAAEATAPGGFLGAIDAVFGSIVAALEKIIFFDIAGMPLVVLWLIIRIPPLRETPCLDYRRGTHESGFNRLQYSAMMWVTDVTLDCFSTDVTCC